MYFTGTAGGAGLTSEASQLRGHTTGTGGSIAINVGKTPSLSVNRAVL